MVVSSSEMLPVFWKLDQNQELYATAQNENIISVSDEIFKISA